MQLCTACQKAVATVVVLDIKGGALERQQFCAPCAETMGVVAPKVQIKVSAEILEDLLGGMKQGRQRPKEQAACPGCGLAQAEFRQKGRLGCPRCYETFREDLIPLLQRVHEASSHKGRLPSTSPSPKARAVAGELSELRRRLEEAVKSERYEEAARLRDELRMAENRDAGEQKP
ncbi:MAG: UvrB/UvrC motif-containing protein [Planctomycetota bacterium]